MFVFPAFDSNYKTRKRTFRCCKKCRNKRIRCIILNADYDVNGCDNCRAHGFTCDLATPLAIKKEDDAESATSQIQGQNLKTEPSAGNPYAAGNTYSGGSQPRVSQAQIQGQINALIENAVSSPSIFSSLSLPEITRTSSQSDDPPFKNNDVKPANMPLSAVDINAGPTRPSTSLNLPTDGYNSENKGVTFDGASKAYLAEQSTTDSWQFTPPFPPTVPVAPYVPSIESIDTIIDKIDWRYLKKHFDFNTTIRQPRFYFAKTLSRKESPSLQVETVTEVLSRKHSTKSKKLTAHNALHFKFLLSMHAFTLNTPGFCDISDTDLLQLFEIYFYKVNSVFPIVFETEFWELYKRNKIPTTIVYAIVLVTARDELAEPILARSFVDNGTTFRENQVRFLTELEMKIRQVLIFLPELGDTEKLARLITQLLLSLNFKFNKFGNEQSSHDLVECISYAYSLLIHQEFFHVRIAREGAQKKSAYLRRLWWVIFIFDRFNGLMNGKAMFIKRLDFNIARPTDLPHLDELVGIAYALEDTLIAAFRPPRISGDKEVIATQEALEGDPEFRPGDFIEQEMKMIGEHEKLKASFVEYRRYEDPLNGHLPGIPVERYRDRMVLFLLRILSNQIVLILRTGQVKYSDDTPDMDEFSLILSESFLSLLEMLKDGRGSQLVMEMPIIPLIMLVAFSVPLTTRLRIISKLKNIGNMFVDFKKVQKVGELSKIYLRELEKFAEKWWFVNEVVSSINTLNLKMDLSDKTQPPKKRKKSIPDEPKVKRERLSINSLVTDASDVETVLPPLLSITSPGFYDEVITKEESDDEDEVESSDDVPDTHLNPEEDLVNMKVLVPPLVRNFSMPSFVTKEDLAYRAQEIRNLSTNFDLAGEQTQNGPIFSSRESMSSNEDVNFDVGQLAELVTNETSFVPSIMDYFNEQELSI